MEAITALRYLAGTNSLNDVEEFLFDLDKDQSVTMSDVIMMLRNSVTYVPVTGVRLSETEMFIYAKTGLANVDGSFHYQLKAKVTPANATDQTIHWSSTDPSAATVDEFGVITPGMSEGVTTIRATTDEGGYYAECAVSVGKRYC